MEEEEDGAIVEGMVTLRGKGKREMDEAEKSGE